jgi:hypothetical protein
MVGFLVLELMALTLDLAAFDGRLVLKESQMEALDGSLVVNESQVKALDRSGVEALDRRLVAKGLVLKESQMEALDRRLDRRLVCPVYETMAVLPLQYE